MPRQVAVAGAGDYGDRSGVETLRAMFLGTPSGTIRLTPRPLIDSIETAKVRHVFNPADHKSRTLQALARVGAARRMRLGNRVRR